MSDLVAGDGYGSAKKGQEIEDIVVFLESHPCVNMYEHFFFIMYSPFYSNRTI